MKVRKHNSSGPWLLNAQDHLGSWADESSRDSNWYITEYGNEALDPEMSVQRPARLLLKHPFVRWNSSSSSSSIEKKSTSVDVSLPLLQRPLGIKDRPAAHNKTWDDARKELMDQETRLQQRQHL